MKGGRRVSHDNLRTPFVHISGPGVSNTPKFHEKTPREMQRARMGVGEGKTKCDILGPPPFWSQHFLRVWIHSLPLGPRGCSISANSTSASWPKSSWPKSKLSEVEQMVFAFFFLLLLLLLLLFISSSSSAFSCYSLSLTLSFFFFSCFSSFSSCSSCSFCSFSVVVPKNLCPELKP